MFGQWQLYRWKLQVSHFLSVDRSLDPCLPACLPACLFPVLLPYLN
jgi:hypothetical protein